jgi:hypothetical protein
MIDVHSPEAQQMRQADLTAYDALPPRVRSALAVAFDNLDACTVARILPAVGEQRVVEMIETGR